MQFRDDNGLLAVVGHRNAAWLTALGLHALHTRGNAGCGLAVSDGSGIRTLRGSGPTEDVFHGAAMDGLRGAVALGQVYGHPSPGMSDALFVGADLRPVVGRYRGGSLAVALSGRLTNGSQLRRELTERGRLFHSHTDAELIAHLIADSGKGTFVNRVVDALWQAKGAYALVVATEDRVVAVRDARGLRPLVLGRVDGAHVVASDESPITLLGGDVLRELSPGELAVVEPRRLSSVRPFPKRDASPCSLEPGLFAGPAGRTFGITAEPYREALGERLATDHPVADADVVVGMPGEAQAGAIGFARVANRPLVPALIAAEPSRHRPARPPRTLLGLEARLRWTVVPVLVANKRVVFVVPSVATGQDVRAAVQLLREAGAASVDVRCIHPAKTQACRYGVSSPVSEELSLPRFGTPEDVATWLDARSMAYQESDAALELLNADRPEPVSWCQACMTGTYPIPPEAPEDQLGLFDAGTDA